MRILTQRANTDERARLALDVFCYRARKYVGAYLAAMGGAAAVVFSGGIGEHAPGIRQSICEGLRTLGLELDPARNADMQGREGRITREGSRLHAYVIPTDEGLMMAHLALRWQRARDYQPHGFHEAIMPTHSLLGRVLFQINPAMRLARRHLLLAELLGI